MPQIDYKKLVHPIALNWLNGNESWKRILETIIEEEIPEGIDEETTFSSLVSDINHLVNEVLIVYIEEAMYDILSERETFNEQEWEGKSKMFQHAVKVYLTDQVDVLASNILDNHAEDRQYSRSPARYFGHDIGEF